MIGTRRIPWIKTLVAFFLIAGLPIFVWAVATQRLELRKKAATSEPIQVCWNRVMGLGNILSWPDGCKGSWFPDRMCTQALVPLSDDEKTAYNRWVSIGKPYIPGCDMPTPKECAPCQNNSVCPEGLVCKSFPYGPGGCMDDGSGHEICNKRTVKLLCAKSDGSSNCETACLPRSGIYCGGFQGTSCPTGNVCIYSNGTSQAAFPDDSGTCEAQQTTTIKELLPQYCPPTTPTPPSPYCSTNGAQCVRNYCPTVSPCPSGAACLPQQPCYIQYGICQNNRCVACSPRLACLDASPPCNVMRTLNAPPFCPPTPTPTSTGQCSPNGSTCTTTCPPPPTCPSGSVCSRPFCPIQQGICQNKRCVPITPTPTPPPNCYYRQVPCFRAPCPPILVCPSPCPTPPTCQGLIEGRSIGGGGCPIYSCPPTPTPTNTPTSTPTPTPPPQQTIELFVRLAGVPAGEANGAKINKIMFYLKDGSVREITAPLTLVYEPNMATPSGIYKTSVTIANPLFVGTQFKISVKGEKHAAVKFCQAQGQTAQCKDADYITMPNWGVYTLVLTGIPLPPGDLNQDGVINNTDLTLLTNLLNKPSSQHTAEDLRLADVNYDGYVDGFDLSLILQSLSIRYDE